MAPSTIPTTPTASPGEAKATRTRKPTLAVHPLGLRLPKADVPEGGTAINGHVTVGWLRALVRSIPKSVPDTATVGFSAEYTAVSE